MSVVTISPSARNFTKMRRQKIPQILIKEVLNGVPLYYKGYKDVLEGNKTQHEIMGSSGIQSIFIEYLLAELFIKLNRKLYRLFSGETGSHLDKNINLAFDIAIYDKSVLTTEKITKHYVNVPPKIVIEIDIDVESESLLPDEIVYQKTQKLLDWGVERVFWIMTKSKKVVIAEPNKDWLIKDWNQQIELFEGIQIHIGEFLREENINLDVMTK
jgi:Uma2 family endonuclease